MEKKEITYLVYAQIGGGWSRQPRYIPTSTRSDMVASWCLVFGPDTARLNPEGDVEVETNKVFQVADYVGLTNLLGEADWHPRTKVGLGNFIESLISLSVRGISP